LHLLEECGGGVAQRKTPAAVADGATIVSKRSPWLQLGQRRNPGVNYVRAHVTKESYHCHDYQQRQEREDGCQQAVQGGWLILRRRKSGCHGTASLLFALSRHYIRSNGNMRQRNRCRR
jgi:hypothetical protein